ncbi:MAG: hypothetical protein KC983_05115, partial [Phycisphaerales bacterium]|nr:hypothetical protein [Phycisphaerales bacterium]
MTTPAPSAGAIEPAGHRYETVLAPVSFSPACTAACRAARAVAPKASFHAFHGVHLPFSGLT